MRATLVLSALLSLPCVAGCSTKSDPITRTDAAEANPVPEPSEPPATNPTELAPAPTAPTPEPIPPPENSDPQPEAVDPATPPPAAAPNDPISRWLAGVHTAPSRAAPPASSVLGRLPNDTAIALVDAPESLELVAAPPSNWRLRLTEVGTHAAMFEPASGLVLFLREDKLWAIDLLEPQSAEGPPVPAAVELGRLDDAPGSPSRLLVCLPAANKPFPECFPGMPLPSDLEFVPEYLSLEIREQPRAAWHFAASDYDENAEEDEERIIDLVMTGADWLRARADRARALADINGSAHGFWQAEPLVGITIDPAHCLDAEDCGKSLPLGVSGWEYVVLGSSRGDLFHLDYAVFDRDKMRWSAWKALIDGNPAWTSHDQLPARTAEIGDEQYPLFDAGGRGFADPLRERLCGFVFTEGSKRASGVRCADAGGEIVAFLSVPVELGAL